MNRGPWKFPRRATLQGNYVRLELLSAAHIDDLWTCASVAPDSFLYLRYGPFQTREQLAELISDLGSRKDQPFWAVLGKHGRAEGWLSICDVYQNDGAFEIGSIWFAPSLQGSREAREAIFLLMCLGMDDFQYERLVWRCQAQNERSFRAAISLGFKHEGTWRNALVYDRWQRDIAWFSILRSEWPLCRTAIEEWLSPANFDESGLQKRRLQDLRRVAEDR
ncbi:N-acetyltransferase [Loktanella sp. IMCC34160]|uniref:GNAT family N-acetyltransferase n=1 Tax=Loktanella sp. IMCC34160 TaxID=2510646 RepID=UPI00101BB5BE|nr:GNAT family protein [Loktanella sp. IMCC34160]RYG93243.1 N-acetyltransferase [Loktanella sp. IMCC34160]